MTAGPERGGPPSIPHSSIPMKTESSTPVQVAERLALFPDSTRLRDGSLTVAGLDLASLAEEFGTPLYLYDRETMDASAARYASALQFYEGPAAGLTYAGKAYLCRAIAEWVESRGLWLDCTGQTEIRMAQAGGVPRERILVHGVNKSPADLNAALEAAGTIVVDNLHELERLRRLPPPLPNLWLRLLPGAAVQTHHPHTQTGQPGSKFGLPPAEFLEAAALCRREGLPLTGLHFHLGSNFRDPSPLAEAIELGLELAHKAGFSGDWHFSPGGGWGAAYHEDELPQPDLEEYVHLVLESVTQGCCMRSLPVPSLHLEPGRSLIARASVALYRVGAVKREGGRTWLLVDGGMTDNPRHAMYGSRYTALPVTGTERPLTSRADVAGPLCESGDVLIEGLPLPSIEPGELLAVPMSGAYHLSMSSNYNGTPRPAVLWLEAGSRRLIQRRETPEDLMRRDAGLHDPLE